MASDIDLANLPISKRQGSDTHDEFTIRWKDGAYYVTTPNLEEMRVVPLARLQAAQEGTRTEFMVVTTRTDGTEWFSWSKGDSLEEANEEVARRESDVAELKEAAEREKEEGFPTGNRENYTYRQREGETYKIIKRVVGTWVPA